MSKTHKVSRMQWLLRAVGLFVVVLAGWLLYLNHQVTSQFEGKKWALPSKVYARPLELYEGKLIQRDPLVKELKALGYQPVEQLSGPGQFWLRGQELGIHTRAFDFWDEPQAAQVIKLRIAQQQIQRLWLAGEHAPMAAIRLEPLLIGGFYPDHRQDRQFVALKDVPPLLGSTLIAVEDRNFVHHYGLSFRGIARAFMTNLREGKVAQGGSTLTQQLVKNFYLSHERSLKRKVQEAFMSLLLELHYSKADILEAYINEVYLGQSGALGVHGFGQAAQYYFKRPLSELRIDQVALLVGLVKGASYYNPWRHPERATDRRNVVLEIMKSQQLITEVQWQQASNRGLGIVSANTRGLQAYPAFMQLVREQLQRDYRDEDLRSEGLRITTTFSPAAQWQAEASLQTQLQRLESGYQLPKESLQSAMLVTSIGNGEVLAVVGDRNPQFSGFNRALDARRQVGSLMKPLVFLTALQSDDYHLASLISDEPVAVKGPDGEVWRPQNFSRQSHGQVPLFDALSQSMNQATARLGMTIGLDAVTTNVERSADIGEVAAVPAMLLGATSLSPLQVTEMYHTLAAEGMYTPLNSIRAVYTADRQPLKRYPLTIERRFSADATFMLQHAMEYVMHEGSGRSAYQRLPKELRVAGKTGTTNDQRDSWFAGFSADHLAVVWVGRDDNGKTPLTGAKGALQIWADFYQNFPSRGLSALPPMDVEYYWVNRVSGRPSDEGCENAVLLPFKRENRPEGRLECDSLTRPISNWWKRLWQ